MRRATSLAVYMETTAVEAIRFSIVWKTTGMPVGEATNLRKRRKPLEVAVDTAWQK